MKFLSVCSGIEAASCAWEPLGFTPVAFSEIEPFPCSVLAHRFPSVPNLGDMTKFEEWNIEPGAVDILVGGTPCQSFSVAGLRGGLTDDRGNLALIYCRILQKFKPRWFAWENVPGVLSSNGGRDFGSILGAMVELGYGIAYRVLDAQYFGVPQRRRRVFVVGCAGDWRRAAEVLFEPGCVSGDSSKGRKARQAVAGSLASRTSAGGGLGTDFDLAGGLQVAVPSITSHYGKGVDSDCTAPLVSSFHTTGAGWWNEGCGTLRGRPQDSHENVVAFQCHGSNVGPMGTLRKGDGNVQSGVPFIAGTLGANHGNIKAEHAWTGQLIPSTGRLSHCLNAGGMGRQDYETETLIASAYRTAGDGAVYDEGDKVAPLTTSTDPNANVTLQGKQANASAQKGNANSPLQALREEIGEEETAKWGLGILDSLQSTDVLRSILHGKGIRYATFSRCWSIDCAISREEDYSERVMQSLREAECSRCPSQGWKLPEQLGRQLGAYLSKLPQPGPQAEIFMHDLREACKGSRLLQQALCEIQKVWRSADNSRKESLGVRMLLPVECEFLQGFPRNWTLVPHRGKPAADGPRYKAIGNSMAVPVMRWIGKRIEEQHR